MESTEQEGVEPAIAVGAEVAPAPAVAGGGSGGGDGGGGGADGAAVNKVRLRYSFLKCQV